MRAFGAPQEILDSLERNQRDSFEVWQENWEAVQMFLRLQTQWSVGGMGGFLGLRYESVDFVFRTYKIKNKKEVLEGLQVMELAAMRELNKEKS